MIFEIIIHSLPQEIDELQNTLVALKRSSYYLDNNHEYKINVTLNTNLIDWTQSTLPIEFFIDKLTLLEKITSTWANTNFVIEKNGKILGNFSNYRTLYSTTDSDFVINIDTDIIFSETLLVNMVNAAESLSDVSESFILIPEISKLWDNSWDDLVHETYKTIPPSLDNISADPYQDIKYKGDIYLDQLGAFKFGMGWFTLINKNIFKNIILPESMGHYGLDDTFIMACCEIIKKQGNQINQYILRNEVVRENSLFRSKIYDQYLKIIDKKNEFRTLAELNFMKEVNNFKSKNI